MYLFPPLFTDVNAIIDLMLLVKKNLWFVHIVKDITISFVLKKKMNIENSFIFFLITLLFRKIPGPSVEESAVLHLEKEKSNCERSGFK